MEIGGGDRNGRHGWPARSRRQGDFGTHQEGCQCARIDRLRSGDFTRAGSWRGLLDGKEILGRIKKDDKVHALIVRDLVISLDLDLGGPWYAGHLRSRGYGLIRKEGLWWLACLLPRPSS